MTEAVERFMERHHRPVRQAAKNVTHRQLIDHLLVEGSEAMLSSREEAEKRTRRQKRYARYLEAGPLRTAERVGVLRGPGLFAATISPG